MIAAVPPGRYTYHAWRPGGADADRRRRRSNAGKPLEIALAVNAVRRSPYCVACLLHASVGAQPDAARSRRTQTVGVLDRGDRRRRRRSCARSASSTPGLSLPRRRRVGRALGRRGSDVFGTAYPYERPRRRSSRPTASGLFHAGPRRSRRQGGPLSHAVRHLERAATTPTSGFCARR